VTASRTTRFAAVLLAATLVAPACSHKKKPPVAVPTTESPTPSQTPSPTPTPTRNALVSPFTGLPVDRLRPVIAVKVDNATRARPQWGLDKADIVYEEAVEGRTTRFLAIFSSQGASQVGPVRSARESDMPLLRMYGRVAFAFSGGNSGVLAIVRQSPVYEVSRDRYGNAYTTMGRRVDAYNYVTSTDRILSYAPKAEIAHDIGYKFGAMPKGVTRSGRTVSLVWSRYAHTSWTYDPTHKRYVRFMDGARSTLRDGGSMTSPNVLIQYCPVRNSLRFSDVHGVPSPYTTTIGHGTAVLLRDGKAIVGTWVRDGFGATHFRDKAGKAMPFRPGPVWVMLAPNDLSAVVR
jgi:hypothetical protein